VRAYNRYLHDPYMSDITFFKGGTSVGVDWVSRHFENHIHYAKAKYAGLLRRFSEVNLGDLLADNWFRLIILNGLDRVAVIRQCYPAFSARSAIPDSNSYAFTQVTQGGLLFNGWLKGSLLNVLQFSAVVYPALYFANRTSEHNRLLSFAAFYTLFDLLLYPLDKAKTLVYADYAHAFRGELGSMSELGNYLLPRNFSWAGASLKLAYNLPWFWTLRTTVNDSSTTEKALAWGTLALAYPLTTLKSVMQVSESSPLSFGVTGVVPLGLYRGLVPFLLANALGQIALYNLTIPDRRQLYKQHYVRESRMFLRDSPAPA